jgi:hypothetical protein
MSDRYPSVKDEGIRRFLAEGEKLYPADAVNFTMAQQREFYNKFCAHFDYPHPRASPHMILRLEMFRVAPTHQNLRKPNCSTCMAAVMW